MKEFIKNMLRPMITVLIFVPIVLWIFGLTFTIIEGNIYEVILYIIITLPGIWCFVPPI